MQKNRSFFASKRPLDYIKTRFELEKNARDLFIQLGGKPLLARPYTMVLGPCVWLESWYPNPAVLTIKLEDINPFEMSFTYGDLFPAFKFDDGLEHFQKLYRVSDLPEIISKFGLPQVSNPDGKNGPKRYIEAQIWSDELIKKVRENYSK